MAKNRPSLSKHSLFTSSRQNNSVLLYEDADDHGKAATQTLFKSEVGPRGESKSTQATVILNTFFFFFLTVCFWNKAHVSGGPGKLHLQKQLGAS